MNLKQDKHFEIFKSNIDLKNAFTTQDHDQVDMYQESFVTQKILQVYFAEMVMFVSCHFKTKALSILNIDVNI